MTSESLMLIAQLYFSVLGGLAFSGDLVTHCSSWMFERHFEGWEYIYMHFLSVLCHLKYRIVRKKENIEPISFGKVEDSSFSCWTVS